MSNYPDAIKKLINHFRKLPGVGSRTAERFAFDLLEWDPKDTEAFATSVSTLGSEVQHCEVCHCFKQSQNGNTCAFCNPQLRDTSILSIIAHPKDAYTFEDTRSYRGLYHSLGGLLSPLSGKTLDTLNLHNLEERVKGLQIKEVIIALDSTLEGDTTALYLRDVCTKWGVKATRLAFGLPMGSSLDFVDGGTLMRAIEGRQVFQ